MKGDVYQFSQSAIHKAVRNCLFNDLGVNRETIKADLRAEVTGAASGVIHKQNIESWVTNAISRAIWGTYRTDIIKKLIDDEVQKQVKAHVKAVVDEYLKNKLSVEIKL